MRMKWGEKGSNDENGEMMEDDLYWLIARWKRRKKKAEGDDDDVGVEWREHVDVDQGAWPKAVVDRRDDHMVVNFYKCAVNLRKISSNWENRTIIYVPLLEIFKNGSCWRLKWAVKAVIRRWFWNKSNSIFKKFFAWTFHFPCHTFHPVPPLLRYPQTYDTTSTNTQHHYAD